VTLNVGSALTGGFRRVANRNGAVLALAYLALGIVWQVAFYSAFVELISQSGTPSAEIPLPAVGLPLGVAAAVAVLSLVALQYLTIVAIRTFVGGHARSIPAEYYTRNAVVVLINSVLAGIAFGIIVFVGTLAVIVPGIIAYVAFVFTPLYVAAEDENFVAALGDSWHLTRGNWFWLFVLLAIVVVVIGAVSGVLSVVSSLYVGAAAGQALGTLVSGTVALPFSILTLGILADAFTQLRDGQAGTTGTTEQL